MKEACLILLLVVCVATAISTVDKEWETYKAKYNKQYSAEENFKRRNIYYKHKIMIEEHNQKYKEGKVTFEMGINKLTDLLLEETINLRGYKQKSNHSSGSTSNLVFHAEKGATYPATVDWRDKGYVTPVKDQGDCGSSWAFAATGTLEGQNFAKTGKLVSLSEQNLVDCDEKNYGCDGGLTSVALGYVMENNGIDTEESYPYKAVAQSCKYDPKNIGGSCIGLLEFANGNEIQLMEAVATIGPIAVAIDTLYSSFNMYKGGVYYEPLCFRHLLNHAALVVGYGNYNGDDYWLVKNSWGTDWGLDGYIMMARNRGDNCGIANEPVYPVV